MNNNPTGGKVVFICIFLQKLHLRVLLIISLTLGQITFKAFQLSLKKKVTQIGYYNLKQGTVL